MTGNSITHCCSTCAQGTYALILHLPTDHRLPVGRLGTFDFPAGYYVYAGSARGTGGIRARVNRHLKTGKPCHWHIDYLREAAAVVDVWFTDNPEITEHYLVNQLIEMPGATLPVVGFGARDCQAGCKAHLIRFGKKPDGCRVIPRFVHLK